MKKMIFIMTFLVMSCAKQDMKKEIAKTLKDDPQILFSVLEENPDKFINALKMAAKLAQEGEQKKRAEEEKKRLEDAYNKPLVPTLGKHDNIRGNKDGVLTLVEYSDFECPYCKSGYNTVQELLKKYKDQIRFSYKHLPLSFHPNAKITAQYFEAIYLQDKKKGWAFHDKVFESQRKLVQNGEKFLKSLAKELKVNMKKLQKDLNSKVVLNKIEADMAEAAKFGFQGTPGFLLNGIPIRGAHPIQSFEDIIAELKKRGKITM